jgi:hypothetical protein
MDTVHDHWPVRGSKG